MILLLDKSDDLLNYKHHQTKTLLKQDLGAGLMSNYSIKDELTTLASNICTSKEKIEIIIQTKNRQAYYRTESIYAI